MAGNLITVTDAGREALVAPGNAGTSAHRIVEIGLATAAFVADRSMKALPNERKRITTFAGENVAPDTIHVTLKDDTADQFTLYGFGLYLENGVLAAAYGQTTPIMEKSPQAMVLLSADVQLTTIDAAQLVFGDASFTNPPATTERQGVVELATQAETDAGNDDTRAVTPKTAAKRYAALTGASFIGDVTFTAGKRLFLDEGSASAPSLTFTNDGASDTGIYHVNDGSFGITCNAVPTVTFSPTGTAFNKAATGPTPAAGDSSTLYATTAWVTSAIASASIGQIVMEPRTSARAGFLKANGALLNRADYPALWAYAQASGALVTEAAWSGGSWACFSGGDGASTFRIPELRGEHLRCWDDGRGIDASRAIGSWQDSQNRSHAHGASSSAIGDHLHSAWTDAQGWHGHHGGTSWVGDHQHGFSQPVPLSTNDTDRGSLNSGFSLDNPVMPVTGWAGGHAHSFDTDGAGNHGHNVGIGSAGAHAHTITVNADGGAEARPRNIALLAMIRAY